MNRILRRELFTVRKRTREEQRGQTPLFFHEGKHEWEIKGVRPLKFSRTRAVLFTHRPLRQMDRADRTRACYLHACLRYVERDPMTNSTLRARLGISEPNKAMVSRIISDAIKDGFVKPEDPQQGKKYAKYVPFWA